MPRIGQQTPYPLIGDYVELLTTTPAVPTAQPVLIPAPELDDGPHLSYAGQWVFFSGSPVAGWILVVRRAVRGGQEAALAASPGEATGTSPGEALKTAVIARAGRRSSPEPDR